MTASGLVEHRNNGPPKYYNNIIGCVMPVNRPRTDAYCKRLSSPVSSTPCLVAAPPSFWLAFRRRLFFSLSACCGCRPCWRRWQSVSAARWRPKNGHPDNVLLWKGNNNNNHNIYPKKINWISMGKYVFFLCNYIKFERK